MGTLEAALLHFFAAKRARNIPFLNPIIVRQVLKYFQSGLDPIFLHQYSLKKIKSEKIMMRWENRVRNGFLQLEKRLNNLGNDGATEIFIS
jgi:hypothetical protein